MNENSESCRAFILMNGDMTARLKAGVVRLNDIIGLMSLPPMLYHCHAVRHHIHGHAPR